VALRILIFASLVLTGSIVAAAQRPHLLDSQARPEENSRDCTRFTLVEVRPRETKSVLLSFGRRTAKSKSDCHLSTVIFALKGTFTNVRDAVADDPRYQKDIRGVYSWHRDLREEMFRYYPRGKN
jgi:hypothetical protein